MSPTTVLSFAKRHKWAIGGTVATLALAAAAHKMKAEPLGSIASSGQSYTTAMPKYLYAAEQQVADAVSGVPLADYRKAEDREKFLQAPAYTAEAYASAAYWLAVVSRLVEDRSLAAKAQWNVSKGSATYALPGSSWMSSGTQGIMNDAAVAAAAVAGKNPSAKAVVALLARHAGAESASIQKQAAMARSTSGQLVGASKASKKDAEEAAEKGGRAISTARGVITGEKPHGVSSTEWFFQKWGLRIGIGAAVAGGLYLYLRPRSVMIL